MTRVLVVLAMWLWRLLVATIDERDRLRAELARSSGKLPDGLVETPSGLRVGSASGDVVVAWTSTGIITVVAGNRSEAEVLALVRHALARCRSGS